MIAGVAGALILPYEVHTTAMGAEVRTQFTLVDVCLENKNSKQPARGSSDYGRDVGRTTSESLPPYLYMLRCWGTADAQEDIRSGNFPRCLGRRLPGIGEDLSDTHRYLQNGDNSCGRR